MAFKQKEQWDGSGTNHTFRMRRTWYTGFDRVTPRAFLYEGVSLVDRDVTKYGGSPPAGMDVGQGDGLGSWGYGSSISELRTQLENSVYEKLKAKAYNTASLGVDLGEMRETLETIASLARAVRNPLRTMGEQMKRAAKRRRRKGGKPAYNSTLFAEPFHQVSEAWLTWSYGVRPVFQSIHDAISVINGQPTLRDRVKASASGSTSQTWSGTPYEGSRNYNATVSGGFDLVVTNANYHLAEQLGVVNPLLIAWELVPFSFVFDGLIAPIGTWIETLSDYSGITREGGWTTLFVRLNTINRDTRPKYRGCFRSDSGVFCQRQVKLPSWSLKGNTVAMTWANARRSAANYLALLVNLAPKRI